MPSVRHTTALRGNDTEGGASANQDRQTVERRCRLVTCARRHEKVQAFIAHLSARCTENPSEGVLIVGSHHLTTVFRYSTPNARSTQSNGWRSRAEKPSCRRFLECTGIRRNSRTASSTLRPQTRLHSRHMLAHSTSSGLYQARKPTTSRYDPAIDSLRHSGPSVRDVSENQC